MYADMEDSDDDDNHDANDIWEKEKMSGVAAATRTKRGNNGVFLKKMYYIRRHHSRYPPAPLSGFFWKRRGIWSKTFY
jgi:hypothetical protein